MHPREIGTGVYDQVIELCQRAGFMPHVAQEARQMPAIVGLMAAGLGVGIVAASLNRCKTFREGAVAGFFGLRMKPRSRRRSIMAVSCCPVVISCSDRCTSRNRRRNSKMVCGRKSY